MSNESTYIIAEIASAHEGDIHLLYKLIDSSARAKADAVKFQIYKAEGLAVRSYRYYGLYERLQFTEKEWKKIVDYSGKKGLDVWIDPYDRYGLNLVKSMVGKITGVKIPPTILSDIELSKEILGLKCKKLIGTSGFSTKQIKRIFADLGIRKGKGIYIMHGFQRYPTQLEDSNLERIRILMEEFKIPVAYADHVSGDLKFARILPSLAVAMGAEIIEKHLTLDRSKKGLDYYSSLNPDEFGEMVKLIRDTEIAIGTGKIKREEKAYLKDATKIVASCRIRGGEIISRNKVSYKRSDNPGILPTEIGRILGRIALKDLNEGDTIQAKNTKKPRICALIAVRMKSKRLPRKALLDIEGWTAIERMVNNLKPSKLIDEIILATSTNEQDDPLEELAKGKRIPFFRGDEDNVIKRFIDAAEGFNADIVVRATGDCPLISYEIADYLVGGHLEKGADYTGTEIEKVPVGTFSEVITLSALKKLAGSSLDLNYSEYMTYYFRNNPDIFLINIMEAPGKYTRPDYRMTLDYPEDLEFFRKIFRKFNPGSKAIPLEKTISFLDRHPEIVSINKDVSLKWRDDKELIKKLNRITKIRN